MAASGDELLSRPTDAPVFREEFRADAEARAARRMIEFSQEEREALRRIDAGSACSSRFERTKR
jgi:hypothetical protein